MKKTLLAVALLPALVMLLAPSRAAASTVSECQAAIATLTLQTQGTTFVGDKAAKVESQLLFHLSKASSGLDKAEFRDAVKQMGDYSSDLNSAVISGTVAAADAAFLQTGAAGVVTCIKAIGQ
jgi:uncharacterized protein YoxC